MRGIVLSAAVWFGLGALAGCGTDIVPPDGGDGVTPVGPSAKNLSFAV